MVVNVIKTHHLNRIINSIRFVVKPEGCQQCIFDYF